MIEIYVDGIYIGGGSIPGFGFDNPNAPGMGWGLTPDLIIGKHKHNNDNSFVGSMDEVSIFDRSS